MFRDVIVRLREQFRCRTFDFPGSGLSPDGPGRDHNLEASTRILEGFIDVLDLQDITMVVHDPVMVTVEQSLQARLADLPVLTLFGRQDDPHGWQARFGRNFPRATATGIADGHHFPFNDDPDAYSAAISAWWAEKIAPDR